VSLGWKGVTTGASDPEHEGPAIFSSRRSPMSSHPRDRPVSALRAHMIEDMRVRGFSEKKRKDYFRNPRLCGFYSTLMVPIVNLWWPASITV
jgi:hypothetical protein